MATKYPKKRLRPISPSKRGALRAILGSILLHLLILVSIDLRATTPTRPEQIRLKIKPPPEVKEKEKETDIPQPKKQIVTPPKEKAEEPPKETPFLTDFNTKAEVEQIKRGENGGAIKSKLQKEGEQTPSSKISKKKPKPKAAKEKKTPLDLKPNNELLSKFALKEPQEELEETSEPFSRSPGSSAQFLGLSGSSDFIPHLKDGDITLLNAKADKFAVFVRRVAIQVFNEIKDEGWRYLAAHEIRQLKQYSTVIAKLSPEGELLSIQLEESSGVNRFDEALKRSVSKGAHDPHPPPAAAASDGNFHFIFQARSWSKRYGNPRQGGTGERRWLILRTGLK